MIQFAGHKRRTLRVLQLLATVVLLLWITAHIAWIDLISALASASLPLILLVCGMYYVGVALSCWKWRVFLDLEGLTLPFGRLCQWYLIGAFAGNYLPTEIGGDLGRAVVAGRSTGQPLAVTRSIFAERFSGLVVMAVFAWVGLIALSKNYALALLILVSVGAGLIGVVWLARRLARSAANEDLSRLPQRLRIVIEDSSAVWAKLLGRPRSLLQIVASSLAFQTLSGIGVWLNLRAVGAELPPGVVIIAATMAGIAGLLPITVNGWGVREGLLVSLLTPLGAPASVVLAGALLGRALLLIVTLPGGLLMLSQARTEFAACLYLQPSSRDQRCKSEMTR